jgi:hypothetical protein
MATTAPTATCGPTTRTWWFFLSDYICEYPNASQAVRVPPGGWGTSLDDYRRRYATVSTLARFVVPAGRAVIERA